MKAVIMAGGQGTRLRSIAKDLPKPMVPVLGKPILEYQIRCLLANGIREIILITGYLGEAVQEYFGDGSAFGAEISYFHEETPLGTGGALYYLREQLSDDFLLLMGDLMLDVDFCRMLDFHRACGGAATLFVHPNSHPYDSDVIVTDTAGELSEYLEDRKGREVPISGEGPDPAGARVTGVLGKKEERNCFYRNQVNAGIYVLSKGLLSDMKEPEGKVDLDKDLIRPMIGAGRVYAYRSTEYVKDMGTPDRYESVSADLEKGVVAARNLSRKQKCIFLDRDGTVNELRGFVKKPEELVLKPEAAEAIRIINRSEYLCILVTNQPVVARGDCSFEELEEIHRKLETELGREGAYIDDIFFCPHHRDRGFSGEVPELKFACRCRKPEPGLLYEAAKRYNIDLEASWIIGDSLQDVLCGKRGGTRTLLLQDPQEAAKAAEAAEAAAAESPAAEAQRAAEAPDRTAGDLLSAVKQIIA